MFSIYDEILCDYHGDFDTFAAALNAVRAYAESAWDAEPNRAPCKSWRKCGRHYFIHEFADENSEEVFSVTDICVVKASGVAWSATQS